MYGQTARMCRLICILFVRMQRNPVSQEIGLNGWGGDWGRANPFWISHCRLCSFFGVIFFGLCHTIALITRTHT